ncbi:NACHT, LRR and PYD domains-containing protein 6-like isoform X2 [Patiria miniata]|nr:NACHT, LRR and PYD domains-containing protein 6-like isoform X2 [Patiria miniata]
MADKTFNINDIDSAYWHKGLPDGNKKFLISNFGGKITWASGLPIGKYDLTANFSLVIHNVSYSDGGPYVWQLKPKASGLLEAVVNITIVAPPERMEDVTPTSQPDAFQQNIVVIVVAILVVVAMVVVLGVCMYKKRNESSCWERRTHHGDHKAIPMDDVDSVRDTLAEELKEFYKENMENTRIHPLDSSMTRTTEDIYIFPAMFKRSHKTIKAETPTKLKGSQSQYLDDQKGEPVKSLDDLKKLLIKNNHVAVIGSAGCGKTALMEKIGYDWACENFTAFKYVVILRKKEICGTAGVLEAIRKLLPADSDITKQQLGEQIKEHKKKVLMVVDGSFLLESSDMNRPASEGDWSLKDVLSFNALRGCSLLITISSHQLDKLRNLHSRFTVIETTGFSLENIKQYIHQFFEDSDKGDNLIKEVQSSTIFETLAKSPIMLQVLCLIWEHKNSLPRQMANVYDRAVNVLAKHISHDGSDQSDVKKIDGFKTSIGKVAFGGLMDPNEERSDFSEGEFPEESLQFGLRIGVMSKETYTIAEGQTCVVKFLHLYQEYFAACFLVHQGNVREQLLPQVTCDTVRKMGMLIRFCCGMNDRAESLITNHLRGLKDGLKTPDDVAWLQQLIEDPSGY